MTNDPENTTFQLCAPMILSRTNMNKKVHIRNPKNSIRKAYATIDRRMTKALYQKGPRKYSPSLSFFFFQLAKNPIAARKEIATPAQRPINPGPGFEMDPNWYRRDAKVIAIPNPKKKREAPWSLLFFNNDTISIYEGRASKVKQIYFGPLYPP